MSNKTEIKESALVLIIGDITSDRSFRAKRKFENFAKFFSEKNKSSKKINFYITSILRVNLDMYTHNQEVVLLKIEKTGKGKKDVKSFPYETSLLDSIYESFHEK